MNRGCVSLLLVLVSLLPIQVRAQDTECQQLKTLERDLLVNLPVAVDDLTRLVGLNVNCVTREIQFVKRLAVPASAIGNDAGARKQAQYVALHCNRDGFATKGWTTRDYIYDSELQLVMELEATPRQC